MIAIAQISLMTEHKIMRGFCDVFMAFVSCNIARDRHLRRINCIN